jgi:hypothetical protein
VGQKKTPDRTWPSDTDDRAWCRWSVVMLLL